MKQENLFKLTQEAKDAFIKRIAEAAFADVVEKTKAGTDNGTFRMIISDDVMDRQGDMVDQNGFDLKNYLKNPVVLWGHDYYNLPIGVTDNLITEGNKTIAEGRFAPTPEAQKIRQYYDAGMPMAASIGYIPGPVGKDGKMSGIELLEWSMVSVPANADCVRASLEVAREKNLDIAFLSSKGLSFEIQTKEVEKTAEEIKPEIAPEAPIEEKAKKETDPTNPSKDELDTQLREDMKAEHDMHHDMAKAILSKAFKAIDESKSYKGAVGEELQETEERKKKYGKLDKAWDVFYAFTNAYMEETTPVEDFEKLLDEAVALMKGVADAEKVLDTDNETVKLIKGQFGKKAVTIDHAKKCMKEMKSEHGRHESEVIKAVSEYMQKMTVGNDIAEASMKEAITTLKSISGEAEKAYGVIKQFLDRAIAPVNEPAAQKSTPEKTEDEKGLEALIKLRSILRESVTDKSKTLGVVNKAIKEITINQK